MTIRRVAVVVSILVLPSLILWGLTSIQLSTTGSAPVNAALDAGADEWDDLSGTPLEDDPETAESFEVDDWDDWDDISDTDVAVSSDPSHADTSEWISGGSEWDSLAVGDDYAGVPFDAGTGHLVDGSSFESVPVPEGVNLDPSPAPSPSTSAPRPAAPRPGATPAAPAPTSPPSAPTTQPSPPSHGGAPQARQVVLPTSCGGLHVAMPDRDGWRNLTWMTQGGQQMNILGLGWNPSSSIGVLVRTDAFWVAVTCGAPPSLERSELYAVTACGVLRVTNGPSGVRRVSWAVDRQPHASINAAGTGWTGGDAVDVRPGSAQFGLAVRCSTSQHLMVW